MKHTVVLFASKFVERKVEFRVSDEGAGIRKEDQEIIFDREMRLPGTTSYGLELDFRFVNLQLGNSRCHVERFEKRKYTMVKNLRNVRFIVLVHYDRSRVYKEGNEKSRG